MTTQSVGLRSCRAWSQSVCEDLTAEVEEVRVEEGLAVDLLDVQDGGALQAAAQGLLKATLFCYERLQHGPHHIQLHTGAGDQEWHSRKAGRERETHTGREMSDLKA